MSGPQLLTVEYLNELREYMIDKNLYPPCYKGKIPIELSEQSDTPENRKVIEEADFTIVERSKHA